MTGAPVAAEVRVVGPAELDGQAHARLQQQAFGPVLAKNGIPIERLSEKVFAWKYTTPFGGARTAIAERDGELLACCSIVPSELGLGERRARGWQLTDAATEATARRTGLFQRIMQALCDEAAEGDWLFGFPNGQSWAGFSRAGFVVVGPVPLRVRPIVGGGRGVADVEPVVQFGIEQDDLALRLVGAGNLSTVRSAAYMNWRYVQHPFYRYQRFHLRREERVDGVLVVSRSEARGRASMWVMELLAVDVDGERDLARHARFLARSQGCGVVLAMTNARVPGTWRMPGWLLPKRHMLVVRRGGAPASGEPEPWDVQTGDWDAF